MLPEILLEKDGWYRGPENGQWKSYLSRIGNYSKSIDKEFLSQICLEHGQRFNDYFPIFDLDLHRIVRRKVKASEINESARYDRNEPTPDWSELFDWHCKGNQHPDEKYPIFDYMMKFKTWPFSPVLVNNIDGFAESISAYPDIMGKPWHLFEGTHRVSFLKRMLELKLITPSSEHEILWLSA